jgi:hypothetical protein
MPDGKRELLWRLVTKQYTRPQRPEELYGRLASEVFDQSAAERLAGMSGEYNEESKKRLLDGYVDKAVDPRYLSAYVEGRAVGSDFIREMKVKHEEDPSRLTYEHLLAARICKPTHNIVLVGPTGSGKSYKLLYVFHKYIWNLSHCKERGVESKCEPKCRMRIRVDVDTAHCETASEFHDKVNLQVLSGLDQRWGQLSPRFLDDRYKEFIRGMFADGQVPPDFLSTLRADGLSYENVRNEAIPSLDDVRLSCLEQGHQREALLLVLRFCGWLRNGRCGKNPYCLYVEFDNVDASPQEVQDALVSLLEDTDPEDYALLVCACRHETLSLWKTRRRILDVVQHAGPTAYDVMMHDLQTYIQKYSDLLDTDQNMVALGSALLNRNPREFLDNLAVMHSKLKMDYLRGLLERQFGHQIRAGLLFAGSIVEIAAAHTKDALTRFMEEQSVYALGRLLYRPYGMNSPVPQIENVFNLAPDLKNRLLGVRLLELLNSKEPYQLSVKDVCHGMRFVAADRDVVACLNNMMEGELTLADVKEHPKLGTDEKSANVRLRLTETGIGILGASSTYNYLSALMYYTYCDGGKYGYPRYTDEECASDATLESVFSTLRIFLRETADIERDDITRAQKYAEAHPEQEDLRDEQGNLRLPLCMPGLYEEPIATAARIAMATNTKDAVDSALNFRLEYEVWRRDIDGIGGVFLPDLGDDCRNMSKEFNTTYKELNATSGGGGGGGGGMPPRDMLHRRRVY